MNKLMNLKKDKKMNLKKDTKGFTLIEIVIVLVIIAVLAAILIPSVTGWINDSKKKAFLSEANSVKQAVTSQIATKYALKDNTTLDDNDWDEIAKKFDKPVSKTNVEYTLDKENKMTSFTYKTNKLKVTYTAGSGWGDVSNP